MQDITEQLQNLEEDGRQYAHFFSRVDTPGYYGIWVRERTPEYVKLWLPHGPLAGYSLALSIEMSDAAFCDYMAELFPDQLEARFLKRLYRIENLNAREAVKWTVGFKNWKQERERLNRVKWLEQYPWVVNTNNI